MSASHQTEASEHPDPHLAAQEHSDRLIKVIRQAIDTAGGAIDFSEYMNKALYEPGLGYYSAGQHKIGTDGDFITAPEMGELFAMCIARQCQQVFNFSEANILEFGAGTGRLCAQLLMQLEALDHLPRAYLILELSPDLQQRQRETLQSCCPHLLRYCHWLDALPEDFSGVILANEVLDAMPVQRFRKTTSGFFIVQVSWDGSQFIETERSADEGELDSIEHIDFAPGYQSELGLWGQRWITTVAERLGQGVILLIDYGFPQHEYYHPQRSMGTLMCHYQHKAHTDPYRFIGLQDITAHVNFSAIAQRGYEAGLEVLGFCHQAGFLLSLGVLELLGSEPAHSQRYLRLSQQVQTLTQASEMGELFKVLALSKKVSEPLQGFQYINHLERL